MRTYDEDDAKRLEPEQWMVELLDLNPGYVSWGPHEDYMWNEGDGWNSRKEFGSWAEFGPWSLDNLNECVNFYFSVERPSEPCGTCAGKGAHPHAQWISESWYRHSSPFTVPDESERRSKALMERFGCRFTDGVPGRGALPPDEILNLYGKPFLEHCVSTIESGGEWSTALTQDEVDALWDAERLNLEFKSRPTAAAVNAWARRGGGFGGHDAINSWICIEQRCKRLGVPQSCEVCEGHGHLFTGPARVDLTLWWLHPRKGCSRGIEVQNIQRSELPAVFAFFREAADRNAQRFEKIPQAVGGAALEGKKRVQGKETVGVLSLPLSPSETTTETGEERTGKP